MWQILANTRIFKLTLEKNAIFDDSLFHSSSVSCFYIFINVEKKCFEFAPYLYNFAAFLYAFFSSFLDLALATEFNKLLKKQRCISPNFRNLSLGANSHDRERSSKKTL